MGARKMVWSVPEGGAATIEFPPMGLESLAEFEEALAILFRAFRRAAEKADGKDPGSLEYASWLLGPSAKG